MRPYPSRRRLSLAMVLTATACLFVSVAPSVAAAPVTIEPVPSFTLPPEVDEFYRAPAAEVAAAQPGQILRARAIAPAFFGLAPLNVDALHGSCSTAPQVLRVRRRRR
ncbi:hypothetical protein [Nocardia brasiliensis]|uniref:hypothetical protein n=1 Tax=Nocardia brasiliensis TaxID=37326 RepID=UPI003D934361